MEDNVPFKLLVLVVCCAIILAVVIVTFQVPDEMSYTDILAERFITPHTEEQVSIQEEEVEDVYTQTISRGEIIIVHDNKRNVTCWCYRGGHKGGISCIPDHMLSP